MDIQGVEIFAVGRWNDDTYTMADLQEMVRAFNENSIGARPHLKIGHDPKQKVAKELLKSDGMPAIGWVDKLYVKGDKLLADFCDIPEKVYAMIQSKSYRKVSSEIFHNIKIGDKFYERMLAAVALLGADNPGVMNLADILSHYKARFDANYERVTINEIELHTSSKGERMEKTEAQIKLELENEKLLAEGEELKEFKAQAEKEKADSDKELADLREFKAKAEKEKAELLIEKEQARIAAFAASLVADKLCTPAMKPMIEALLGEAKKEYSVKVADKEKMISKEDLLKETLKLFKAASEVNFEESSSQGDDGAKGKEDELDKKAKAYAAEHKVTYGAALKAVIRQQV